jgi:hypothetical protein
MAGRPQRYNCQVELVYLHQLKPVLQTGATVMDQLFKPRTDRA